MSYTIENIGHAHAQANQLINAVFGSGRYAKTAERLREEHAPLPQSLVVLDDGQLCACVLLYALHATPQGMLQGAAQPHASAPILLLGPMAVAPAYQQRGLGRTLLRHTLNATQRTWPSGLMVLVGHARYYSAFGFTEAAVAPLSLPGPVDRRRFLGLAWPPPPAAAAHAPIHGA